MSIVLDTTLQSAQDGISHNPIVEIVSSPTVADIPFIGQNLQDTVIAETKPNIIMHSSGRLCAIETFGTGTNNKFYYIYTDEDRSQFYWEEITIPSNYIAIEATLCETVGGNIGIILYCTYSGYEKLISMLLSVEGSVLVAQSEIYSVTTATHILQGPFVIRLANNTYLLVYSDNTVAGPTYAVRKRTSSDFSSWSAEGTCAIGGLDSSKRINNSSLLQISTNEIWCWFDYLDNLSGTNELVNVYYSTSGDDGVTWANATKFTNYNSYDTVGLHPVAAQKITDQIHAVFTEKSGALHLDHNYAGWCKTSNTYPCVGYIQWDSVHRKIYVMNWLPGPYSLQYGIDSVVRIDFDTWAVDACWNGSNAGVPSVPCFNSIWTDNTIVSSVGHCHGANEYICAVGRTYSGNDLFAVVLNGEADTITYYNFADNVGHSLTKNIDPPSMGGHTPILYHSFVDPEAKRLYLLFHTWWYNGNGIYVGYIDLTQTGPTYTLNEVVPYTQISASSLYPGYFLNNNGFPYGDFRVYPDEDMMIISMGYTSGTGGSILDSHVGELRIYTISTGGLLKTYNKVGTVDFPRHGLGWIDYKNGVIYGTFWSCTSPTCEDAFISGLCMIDISTDVITYSVPDYVAFPTKITYLRKVEIADENRLIVMAPNMSAGGQTADMKGIAIYDIAGGTWRIMNNSNVPGMDYSDFYLESVCYDSYDEFIFTGMYTHNSAADVIAFSINGLIYQPVYRVGTYSVGSWSWTDAALLVQGYFNHEAVIALENDDRTIYAFWTNTTVLEDSLMWAKEGTTFDLSSYLVRGKEIQVSRSIDNSPALLSFTISRGHLFDPHNCDSLFSIYLEKGRKLVLRMGERISGIEYWQNLSEFYITERNISYSRENYPTIEVKAQDIRIFWDDALILATEYYETTPKTIIDDLLNTWAGLSSGDRDIPIFVNSTVLYHQWVEVPLKEILDHICGRYGYFMRIDLDGKATAKLINSSMGIDHSYTGISKIISFTPDDSYSDFTNQVIVIGQSRNVINVLYSEEPITNVSGTVGWWGGKKDLTVYYSDDRTKKCTNPRLEVLLSVKSFNFRLGGGGESITYEDPNLLYCIITIDTPDLVAIVIATVAAIIALGISCIPCDGYMTGWCGLCLMALTTLLSLTLSLVCSVANYSYQIYAQPYGSVKQTIQATWDDDDLQIKMGFVNTKKLIEPLCYNIDDCQVVADHEGEIIRLQRNRIRLSKVAHLQDEEGDIIEIDHPQSKRPIKILITNINRRLLIPETSRGHGYFLDDIEGWKI